MILLRLVWPDAMVTEDRGTFKSFAKNSMQASLARPSTGGVVSDSLSASPSSPVMAFFFARGWTLTAKAEPWLLSLIGMLILGVVSFSATPSTGAIGTRGCGLARP